MEDFLGLLWMSVHSGGVPMAHFGSKQSQKILNTRGFKIPMGYGKFSNYLKERLAKASRAMRVAGGFLNEKDGEPDKKGEREVS